MALKALPHVLVTPHMAFLTKEALANIADTTVSAQALSVGIIRLRSWDHEFEFGSEAGSCRRALQCAAAWPSMQVGGSDALAR